MIEGDTRPPSKVSYDFTIRFPNNIPRGRYKFVFQMIVRIYREYERVVKLEFPELQLSVSIDQGKDPSTANM